MMAQPASIIPKEFTITKAHFFVSPYLLLLVATIHIISEIVEAIANCVYFVTVYELNSDTKKPRNQDNQQQHQLGCYQAVKGKQTRKTSGRTMHQPVHQFVTPPSVMICHQQSKHAQATKVDRPSTTILTDAHIL
jgi:hypothetical protein